MGTHAQGPEGSESASYKISGETDLRQQQQQVQRPRGKNLPGALQAYQTATVPGAEAKGRRAWKALSHDHGPLGEMGMKTRAVSCSDHSGCGAKRMS